MTGAPVGCAAVLAAIGWKVIPTIDVGPLSVSPHGLGIAIGYGLGGMLVAKRAERLFGISRDDIWNMLMHGVIGVVVGARLFYIAGHLGDYASDPLGVLRIWEGGIVFYGGAIGGVIAAVPYMRKHGLRFWDVMDAAAPGFPVGLIIGRIGDLIIGDHLGKPTDVPWGFRYSGGQIPDPPPGLQIGDVFHQTALYDLFSVLLLLPVVLWFGRRRRAPGVVMMAMVAWYAVGRFLTDFVRDTEVYAGLHGTQWVSVALMAMSLLIFVRRARGLMPASSVAHDAQRLDDVVTPVADHDDDAVIAPDDGPGASGPGVPPASVGAGDLEGHADPREPRGEPPAEGTGGLGGLAGGIPRRDDTDDDTGR